jgi:hypothetical protein
VAISADGLPRQVVMNDIARSIQNLCFDHFRCWSGYYRRSPAQSRCLSERVAVRGSAPAHRTILALSVAVAEAEADYAEQAEQQRGNAT